MPNKAIIDQILQCL